MSDKAKYEDGKLVRCSRLREDHPQGRDPRKGRSPRREPWDPAPSLYPPPDRDEVARYLAPEGTGGARARFPQSLVYLGEPYRVAGGLYGIASSSEAMWLAAISASQGPGKRPRSMTLPVIKMLSSRPHWLRGSS